MGDFKQTDRLMKFTSPLAKDMLVIESFWGVESVSKLFEFHVELLASTDDTIDLTAIVGAKVNVSLELNSVLGTRYFSGIIASFEQGKRENDVDTYRAYVVPGLWQLTLSSDCRVFQGKTVMEIVKSVIGAYGLTINDRTKGPFKSLDYCTQYQETDFNFISRILEQHGVFYWFEHTDSDNVVNFGDTRDVYADCPLSSDVEFSPGGSGVEGAYGDGVIEFSSTSSMVSGKHTYQDFDFRQFGSARQIDSQTSKSPFGNNAYERFTYPAGEQGYMKDKDKKHVSSDADFGTTFVTAQTIANDATAQVFQGASNARSLCAGYAFTLSKHARGEWNAKYLLTEVIHHANQVPSYRSGSNSGGGYSNQFKAVKADVLVKPLAVTRKPLIHGPQTGIVVAQAGDEIEVDIYGRISVQFFWDRQRKDNTVDNTWVRVAQPWAGQQYGAYFWPRAKQEVVIEFIDGDPDAPLVTGSLYNSANPTPYALPANKTRSGILTHSSLKGGTPANELRFEDKKGGEQVYIHAQMDMDQRVENDSRIYVTGNDSQIVKGGRLEEIDADHNIHVKGNHVEKVETGYDVNVGTNLSEKIGENYSIQVGQNHAHKVGMNYSLDAGMEAYVKAGMTLVIESGMNLCLKGAGGFITIGPAGIAISGTLVLINSGGAAVPGTAGQTQDPKDPKDPDEADDGSKGGKM